MKTVAELMNELSKRHGADVLHEVFEKDRCDLVAVDPTGARESSLIHSIVAPEEKGPIDLTPAEPAHETDTPPNA